MLRHLIAMRYVSPLREGGSLPALVEAEDGQLYVLKFVGAGQGRKALIAELLAGEIARAIGLNVPELVFVDVDAELGHSEPDPEIRDLLRASVGVNLALRFLPGALPYDVLVGPPPDSRVASAIVWFDAYVTNVDRSIRNPNLLEWDGGLWLIDHGATLFFHHTWSNYRTRSRQPFPQIKDHVLLPYATVLEEADHELALHLQSHQLERIVAALPAAWLTDEPGFDSPDAVRAAYLTFLRDRLRAPRAFIEETLRVRAATF